jgi:hypothetical protein
MKSKYVRLAIFLAAALFAIGLSAQDDLVYNADYGIGAGGTGSCKTCFTYGGGSLAGMACVTPDSGGWGTDACWVESYPEQTYCQSVGNACCVD